MPRRNFFSTAALIKEPWLPTKYTVGSEDIDNLLTKVQNNGYEGALDAMSACMRYGYVMGHRATLSGFYHETGRRKRK